MTLRDGFDNSPLRNRVVYCRSTDGEETRPTAARARDLVERDVRLGYVSAEAAAKTYGYSSRSA
jgi:hypothetical protein